MRALLLVVGRNLRQRCREWRTRPWSRIQLLRAMERASS